MKKLNLIFLICLFQCVINAQSIKVDIGYHYYFLNNKNYPPYLETSQDLNYSIGISFLKYFENSSFELGYYYATKNFQLIRPKPYYFYSSILKTSSDYHQLPIKYSQNVFRRKKFNIAASIGMTFIHVNNYNRKTIYENGETEIDMGYSIDFTTGLMADFGLKYSYILNKSIVLVSSANYNYKFVADFAPGNPTQVPSPDKGQVNFKLGVEWLIKKDLKYFNK